MIREINSEFIVINKKEKSKFSISKNNIKIDFYNNELISKVIDKKFNKKYKDILKLLNDEDDNSDIEEIILLKINDLRRLLMEKYMSFINRNTFNKYMKMLDLVEIKFKTLERKTGRGR